MDYLPVFMAVRERPCLVVGGGEVAARKVSLLLRAGARVTVLAPSLGRSLTTHLEAGELAWRQGEFDAAVMAEPWALIYAATDSDQVNRRVSELAREHNVPVNVVDSPRLCTFVMPAIVDRSPVIAAVSTGGASPVLARLLRARLESYIPAAFGQLAGLVRRFRGPVKEQVRDGAARRLFWERIFQGRVAELVFAGKEAEAEAALREEIVAAAASPGVQTGEVYLVGGGPGDPDLLTFRALRLMQQADVVLYDRLVAPAVLDLTRRDAERINVGKARSRHTLPQDDINSLMVELARQGKRVLRLKGGDPFIFGRGGEEIEKLAAEGIPFQVIPGITAASGCASYAGIPLTHRDYAQACIFVTGNLKDGTVDLNWPALAQPRQTVVFYMGLLGLGIICRELQAHGMSPDWPAALVQQGTTAAQRVFTGTLATLPGIVEAEEIRPPTLIIVGEVVRLREKLAWFEGRDAEPVSPDIP